MARSKKKRHERKVEAGMVVEKIASRLILLEGRVPRPLTYQLDHDTFCTALGECRCASVKVGVVKTSKVDGSKSPVFKQRRVPSVLVIRFRKRTQVEEAALEVPPIAAAIAAGKVRIVKN